MLREVRSLAKVTQLVLVGVGLYSLVFSGAGEGGGV